MVAKLVGNKRITKTVGNKEICLHKLILGSDLYDVSAQGCSTGLFLSKCTVKGG